MSGLTIGSVFRNAARAVPHRPAAALGDRALTFAEIDALADRTVCALASAGLRHGDRALCWTGTSLDVVPLFAGLARMGAVYCPLPGTLGAQEAAGIVEVAEPALIITDAQHAGLAAAVAADRSVPVVTVDDVLAAAADQPAGEVPDAADERDPHVLFFTSGSTGRPKGVVLSHRTNYLRSHPGSQEEPRGAMVCVYPLFHMGAWTISLQQWQARDLVAYVPKPDGPAICTAVRRHRAARLNAIPAVWQRVLDHLAGERVAGGAEDASLPGTLPTIRFADSGTSATPPELLAAIADACPQAHLRIFYGSTEAGNVLSLAGADVARKPGSCGVPAQATEVRVDPDTGELCVRGPLLFDGYFGDPEATGTVLRDGWYRTGDVASADDEGYLSIVGRISDLIRTGGESVVPAEVERALRELPGVADVAVVGLPDGRWGEIVCAVVVPDGLGNSLTLDDARAWCASRLAPHKHPRALHLMSVLPRTPATGQVQRRLIVQSLAEKPTTTVREEA